MTYNVFGGTLNPTLPTLPVSFPCFIIHHKGRSSSEKRQTRGQKDTKTDRYSCKNCGAI